MRTLPDTPLRNPYNATTTSNTPNSQATYELSQSTQSTTIESEPTNIINTNPHFHTRNALTSWLTTARRAQRPCNHKGQHAAGSKTSQPGQPKRKHNGHQTTIETQHKSNDHWGDPIDMVAHTPRLRVISRNVNTLNTKQNYLSWRATTQAALDLQADILCLQETNTNWSHNTNTNIKSIFNNTPYRRQVPTLPHYHTNQEVPSPPRLVTGPPKLTALVLTPLVWVAGHMSHSTVKTTNGIHFCQGTEWAHKHRNLDTIPPQTNNTAFLPNKDNTIPTLDHNSSKTS